VTTILALFDAYRDYLQHELQRAPQTVTAYLSDLRGLAKFVDKPIDQIAKNDLRAYLRHMGRQGLQPATVRRKVHGYSTFWNWLVAEGHVEQTITKGLTLPRKERKFARWLTEAELHRFEETPDPNPRNTLAWRLLAWLGLRRNELLDLRCDAVNIEDGVIAVRGTKSRRDRTLPIPEALVESLRAVCQGRDEAAFVLPGDLGGWWSKLSFYTAFRAHARAAGVPGITPHTLRHTVATHMSQRGVPLRVIQQWMGHERMDTTSIYLQVAPEFMQSAMDKHVLNEVRE
jgi:site-specific recombinase XerD